MTDQELYEEWKSKHIHNYEGTRLFAEAHDVSPQEMSKIISKFEGGAVTTSDNIRPNTVAPPTKPSKKKVLSEGDIQRIEDGIAQGKRVKDIAAEVGCSCNTITVRKRKMRKQAPVEETLVQEEDKLTSLINTLKGFKNLVDKTAEMKSITAGVDTAESSIVFETGEASYTIILKKTPKIEY